MSIGTVHIQKHGSNGIAIVMSRYFTQSWVWYVRRFNGGPSFRWLSSLINFLNEGPELTSLCSGTAGLSLEPCIGGVKGDICWSESFGFQALGHNTRMSCQCLVHVARAARCAFQHGLLSSTRLCYQVNRHGGRMRGYHDICRGYCGTNWSLAVTLCNLVVRVNYRQRSHRSVYSPSFVNDLAHTRYMWKYTS